LQAAIALMARQNLVFIGSNRVGNNAFFIRNIFAEKLSFLIPNSKNLESFVDWRIRESRDKNEKLNYQNLSEARMEISECVVLDLVEMKEKKVSEI